MTLRGLIEAVEAGECRDSMFCAEFHRQGLCTECEAAYHGSLDSAKRLHDALLPGWAVANIGHVSLDKVGGWRVWLNGPEFLADFESSDGCAADPARAWLLAILRALEGEP